MSITLESAIDTVRDAGESLRDVGSNLQAPSLHAPNVHVPSFDLASFDVPASIVAAWPDDVLDRVVDEGRRIGARRLLVIGGVVVGLVAVIALLKRRSAKRDSTQDENVDGAAASAA